MAGMTPEEVKAKVGTETGVSEWITVTQEMIDTFADVTFDHQFIHIDPEKAAKTPFGSTIAHGFLTVSLLSKFGAAQNMRLEKTFMGVNYGFDKLRLVSPVKSGANVRGRFTLKDFTERSPGQYMFTFGVTVEIEGSDKPALIADWLTLQFTN